MARPSRCLPGLFATVLWVAAMPAVSMAADGPDGAARGGANTLSLPQLAPASGEALLLVEIPAGDRAAAARAMLDEARARHLARERSRL